MRHMDLVDKLDWLAEEKEVLQMSGTPHFFLPFCPPHCPTPYGT